MQIVDDFMPDAWRVGFLALLSSRVGWSFQERSNYSPQQAHRFGTDYCQMEHLFHGPAARSDYVRELEPLLAAARVRLGLTGKIIRAKANLNFNTSPVSSGGVGASHRDFDRGLSLIYYPHDHPSGTLFFGESGVEAEVSCVANRALVFPANALHALALPKCNAPRFVVSTIFDQE